MCLSRGLNGLGAASRAQPLSYIFELVSWLIQAGEQCEPSVNGSERASLRLFQRFFAQWLAHGHELADSEGREAIDMSQWV